MLLSTLSHVWPGRSLSSTRARFSAVGLIPGAMLAGRSELWVESVMYFEFSDEIGLWEV